MFDDLEVASVSVSDAFVLGSRAQGYVRCAETPSRLFWMGLTSVCVSDCGLVCIPCHVEL